jgi:GT2 family glycosyltransferase
MSLTVDLVVPVRNGWKLTERCLEGLRQQTRHHNIVVCDNASTDGTPERVRRSFPEVHLVELGANLGFSVASNRGVNSGSGEVVVLLNNDVECRPDFLQRLLAVLEQNEQVGSVAALLLTPGGEQIESFGLTADPTLAGFPRLRGRAAGEAQTDRPVLVGPSGAAGAYRRQAWEAVGGLDEGVFSYGEDLDLALRLRAAGWTTAGASEALAVHLGSATAGRRSSWQRYQAGFSRGYFVRRYGLLNTRLAPRAVVTETIVTLADAVAFSRDFAGLNGRIAGWRAAGPRPRVPPPPPEAIDSRITFWSSLRLRLDVF